jgi:hypothetical protein
MPPIGERLIDLRFEAFAQIASGGIEPDLPGTKHHLFCGV